MKKHLSPLLPKLVAVFALCVLFLGVTASWSGVASAHSLSPQKHAIAQTVDDHICAGYALVGDVRFYCSAADYPVENPNTTVCPPPNFFSAPYDNLGHRTDYTYSNNTQMCITVNYPLIPTFQDNRTNCQIWFYVPLGALWTGKIFFGYYDQNGVHHQGGSIDENASPGGWQLAFTARNVYTVTWADNNGQAVGSTRLAWGIGSNYGIERKCTA